MVTRTLLHPPEDSIAISIDVCGLDEQVNDLSTAVTLLSEDKASSALPNSNLEGLNPYNKINFISKKSFVVHPKLPEYQCAYNNKTKI